MRTRPEDGMMKTVGRVDVPMDVFKCTVVVWVGDPVRMVLGNKETNEKEK